MFHNQSPPRRRGFAWFKTLVILIVIGLVAGLGGTMYLRGWFADNLKPVSDSKQEIVVTIPSGASLDEIAAVLKDKQLIRNRDAFERYVSNKELGDKLKAGTYRLQPSLSVAEIVGALTDGKIASDLVTILPARRLDQIAKDLQLAGYSEADVKAALEPSQYSKHPALTDKPVNATLEGYLYPESFLKTDATKASTIITLSLDEMQKRLTPDIRAGITRQGLTLHEGITLASIIEKEVNLKEDRKMVAQVFLLRYKKGMQLGSDVTFFYAAATTGQKPTPDLDSPYNTRRYSGLPPGPISNVSDASLEAVSTPASGDYVYFVSGDDGKTYFSRTQAEHEALAKQHCKKLCELPDTVLE